MLSVVLAFAGAMIYGTSDFLGGIGARRWSSIAVTFTSSLVGLLILLGAMAFVPAVWSAPVLLWGGVAGLAGAGSLILLYACLAIGPMSILAPIMGLIAACLPVADGFAAGERFGAAGITGLILGLVAIVLICVVPGERTLRATPRGIVLAIGAGICVGLYLVFIDATPADSGLAPLTVVFVVSLIVTGGILLTQRQLQRRRTRPAPPADGTVSTRGASPADDAPAASDDTQETTPSPARETALGFPHPDDCIDPDPAPRLPPLAASILAGVTDAPATILFLIALRHGDLAVVSVLSALSPAGTVVLAAALLRERIAVIQWIGLGAALTAAGLLSVP